MRCLHSWRWRSAFTCALALVALTVGMVGTGSASVYARQWAAPPPQFVDPSTGAVNASIASETTDAQGTHVTYTDGAEVTDGTEVTKLPPPANGKTGVQSDDFQALAANHGQLVVVPLDQMVASTSGVATEAGPWVTQSGCVSPPAGFDIATATDAQLALYGFPPVGAMSRSAYNTKYGWMKQRSCQARATNGPSHDALDESQNTSQQRAQGDPQQRVESAIWGGYVADEYNCPASGNGSGIGCATGTPNYYTEADTDFYVPTVTSPGNCSPLCNSAFWVGLGGASGEDELIQDGVDDDLFCLPMEACDLTLYAWIEWVGNFGYTAPIQVDIGPVNPNTHLYATVWALTITS